MCLQPVHRSTKVGGRIAQIGFLTGQTAALNLMPMIFRQTTIRGIAAAPIYKFVTPSGLPAVALAARGTAPVRPTTVALHTPNLLVTPHVTGASQSSAALFIAHC
jgi:threonine dehydrogenase-like Zn-dependent dehydrogenase